QDNPPFSVEYEGFVLGEGVSVLSGDLVLSTTATKDSPPGTYVITAEGSTLDAENYKIVYEPGQLLIVVPTPAGNVMPDCRGTMFRDVSGNEALRMDESLFCGVHAYPGEDADIDRQGVSNLIEFTL